MSRFNRTVGQRIASETLLATAADSRNDVLTTSAVLLSTILCSATGWNILDGSWAWRWPRSSSGPAGAS